MLPPIVGADLPLPISDAKIAIAIGMGEKAKKVRWAAQDHKILAAPSATTSGQYEIVCGPPPRMGTGSDLTTKVELYSTSGGIWTCNLNVQEMQAAPSISNTAIANQTPIHQIQTIARSLSKEGVLATDPYAVPAIRSFIHFLRNLRVNTAKYLTLFEPKRRTPTEAYDFDFQLTCLELAIHYKATGFADAIVLEIRREAYFTFFTVAQFRRALKVDHYLRAFILEWANTAEVEGHWHGEAKLKCLKQALPLVPALRTLFRDHIEENPKYAKDNGLVAKMVRENLEREKVIKALNKKEREKKTRKEKAKKERAQRRRLKIATEKAKKAKKE